MTRLRWGRTLCITFFSRLWSACWQRRQSPSQCLQPMTKKRKFWQEPERELQKRRKTPRSPTSLRWSSFFFTIFFILSCQGGASPGGLWGGPAEKPRRDSSSNKQGDRPEAWQKGSGLDLIFSPNIFLPLLIFVPFLLRPNLFPPCEISHLFYMLPLTKVRFPGLCSSLFYKVMGLIRKGDWMGAGELLKEVWWVFHFHPS